MTPRSSSTPRQSQGISVEVYRAEMDAFRRRLDDSERFAAERHAAQTELIQSAITQLRDITTRMQQQSTDAMQITTRLDSLIKRVEEDRAAQTEIKRMLEKDIRDLEERVDGVAKNIPERLRERLDAIEKALPNLLTANRVMVWVGTILGTSIIALIWALITGAVKIVPAAAAAIK